MVSKLSLAAIPVLSIAILFYLLQLLDQSPFFRPDVLRFSFGTNVFYKYYYFFLAIPLLTHLLPIRYLKTIMVICSMTFFLMLSLESPGISYYLIFYFFISLTLILSLLFKFPYKKLTFFFLFFILTIYTPYFYSRSDLSDTGRSIVFFLSWDSLIAWSWLYIQFVPEKKVNFSIFFDLFLYLFLPFFFIRRLAIGFTEFNLALNAKEKSVDSSYIGWITILRSAFFFLLLVKLSNHLVDEIPRTAYELLRIFIIIYHQIGLVSGLMLSMGMNIREPFDYFLFSAHPIEFWRRWNIYMRDWLSHFYFLPSLKYFKKIEIAFFYTFIISGIYHIFKFIILGVDIQYEYLFKFWIPGLILSFFSFFYIRYYAYFKNLSSGLKNIFTVLGIFIFWISYYYIRSLVIFVSDYFSN